MKTKAERERIFARFRQDYVRLLIQGGYQPSEPNALDFIHRLGSPDHYRTIGGNLECSHFPAWGL